MQRYAKIMKCGSTHYWYSDEIGKTYPITRENDWKFTVKTGYQDESEYGGYSVDKCDVIVLNDTQYMDERIRCMNEQIRCMNEQIRCMNEQIAETESNLAKLKKERDEIGKITAKDIVPGAAFQSQFISKVIIIKTHDGRYMLGGLDGDFVLYSNSPMSMDNLLDYLNSRGAKKVSR